MTDKHVYVSPEVKPLGDVRTLTRQNVSGSRTDKSFNSNTPISQLTFSG